MNLAKCVMLTLISNHLREFHRIPKNINYFLRYCESIRWRLAATAPSGSIAAGMSSASLASSSVCRRPKEKLWRTSNASSWKIKQQRRQRHRYLPAPKTTSLPNESQILMNNFCLKLHFSSHGRNMSFEKIERLKF